MTLQNRVAELLAGASGLPAEQVLALLEVPPNPSLGDYAFPCFTLAKTLRKSPPVIAAEIAAKLSADWIEHVAVAGAYVNITIKTAEIAKAALNTSRTSALPTSDCQTICIESPAPNTNKPLHLGHVRNMLLGVAVRTLLARRGHKVHALDLVNDRGVHICKSMLAYNMVGHGATPSSTGMKGDHFVGKYYVEYSRAEKDNPELEKEAQAMLIAWEENNPDVRALWSQMREWCLAGFAESYKNFGVEIEKTYYESEIYLDGKDLILDAAKRGVFKTDAGELSDGKTLKGNTEYRTGAVYADLTAKGLGNKVLLRADGSAIYITQDIALAKKRFDTYQMDRMLYVVGNEQNHHFQVLFSIFEQLGFSFAPQCKHMSYGYVSLPTGRMKSREGTVVDADDLRREMIALAAEEITKRTPELAEEEVARRAEAIGMGALRFYILKYDPARDFVYDPAESISFAGETGPYVQYTYARIQSIFRKASVMEACELDVLFLVEPREKQILNALLRYEEVVATAADKYEPYHVATYVLDLAQIANSYYHDTQILVDEVKLRSARLALLRAVSIVIKDALSLLGITALDEM